MAPVPYCGSPPVPGHLAWNLDPVLIACLIAIAMAYGWRSKVAHPYSIACFAAGWLVLALALISPLCNLSVALFSARVTQHMVMTLVAAPLIVLGIEEGMLAAAPKRIAQGEAAWASLTAMLFAVVLWTWHAPEPYDASFQSTAIYWLMHFTMLGSALLLWHTFLSARSAAAPLLVGAITMLQMSLLGALLTFARLPLFDVHSTSTWSWGLSPLEDQELGGLIMWIAGGVLLTAYGVLALGLWMHRISVRQASATVELESVATRNLRTAFAKPATKLIAMRRHGRVSQETGRDQDLSAIV